MSSRSWASGLPVAGDWFGTPSCISPEPDRRFARSCSWPVVGSDFLAAGFEPAGFVSASVALDTNVLRQNYMLEPRIEERFRRGHGTDLRRNQREVRNRHRADIQVTAEPGAHARASGVPSARAASKRTEGRNTARRKFAANAIVAQGYQASDSRSRGANRGQRVPRAASRLAPAVTMSAPRMALQPPGRAGTAGIGPTTRKISPPKSTM